MNSPLATTTAPFGRVLTAMATPFTSDGALDLAGAQRLATYLVDSGNDGLVVSGTTGESPTTTGEEDRQVLSAVLEAVGDRATILAGVGTNDTRHSVELAQQAKQTGAHGLLIVTPYYSKPPQAGIIEHVRQVSRAGQDLPVLLYDIPGRTGTKITESSYVELVKNPLVLAVKDATGDLERGAWLRAELDLPIYSGDDALNLAWLAIGACGVVSVLGHVAAREYAQMITAIDAGDLTVSRAINEQLAPVVRALMGPLQGAVSVKAAMQALGVIESRAVRSPLVPARDEETAAIAETLSAAKLF